MPPLRLAVDARVIAEDTRGIGRYLRAVLRRLILRDDIELTLLAEGLFPQRRRAAFAQALGHDDFTVRARVPNDAEVVWHPANGTFFLSPAPSVAPIPTPSAASTRSARSCVRRAARSGSSPSRSSGATSCMWCWGCRRSASKLSGTG
jgi:hypothetical protein